MIEKIKFYIKIMIKTPLLTISLLFNLFLIYKQRSILKHSLYGFSEVFCFGFIASNLFLLITSVVTMYKEFEVLQVYDNNQFRKQTSIILSGVIISMITSITAIIGIIIFSNPNFGYIDISKAIIHFLVIWNLSNLISLCIGTTIGVIIKNGFSLIISLAIYNLFIVRLFALSNSILYNLFNIFDDFTIIQRISYDSFFNLTYFTDKLFVILLSMLIISIGNLFNKKVTLSKCLITIVLSMLLFLNIYIYKYATMV